MEPIVTQCDSMSHIIEINKPHTLDTALTIDCFGDLNAAVEKLANVSSGPY